ncbi:MAG: diguanylate cyclase [Helicobacteraceae bacterium]|nr:diguanylate cyclase [Helicobacteraceae bacterium]
MYEVFFTSYLLILTDRLTRESDTVSRWGGEEFLIVVENITKESIFLLAEKLRTTIETHKFFKIEHKTASLGITIYNENDTITTLISRVDKALYEAKNSGRNRTIFAQ